MTIAAVDQTTSSAGLERECAATAPTAAGFDAVLSAARSGSAAEAATHRVRSGETLSGIMLAHLRAQGQNPSNTDLYDAVAGVAAANGLANPDRIYPGQVLTLEAPVAQQQASESDLAREELVRALVPPRSAAAITTAETDMGGPKRPIHDFSSARLESFRQVATGISDALTHPIRYAKGAESLLRFLPVSSARTEMATVAALKRTEAVEAAISTTGAGAYNPWKRIVAEPARLTSEFGPRRDPFDGSKTHHDGIDLATKRGSKIYPMAEGTVKFSGWMPGYGNVVVLKHGNGMESVYGHNAKNLVRAGEAVSAGDAIATVGSSGRSTGPHVHFEIRKQGHAVDPVPLLTTATG